jgi:polysaccharide export outer membrane protein
MGRRQYLAASLALCASAVGCASLPPAPPTVPEAESARFPGLTRDPAPVLRLRPGDTLEVSVETEPPAPAREMQVDAAGFVHLPSLGRVAVGGLTLDEAESRMRARAREDDRLAEVFVRLQAALGQRATVLGAVGRQGTVAVTPGMRLSDLVLACGGVLTVPDPVTEAPRPLGDLPRAVLTRDGSAMPVDVGLAMRGDPAHDVYVHAGDYLFVPPRLQRQVTVFGQVASPTVFPHAEGLRMTEALAVAGGVTPGGDKGDIRLLRGPVEAPRVYRADLNAVISGRGPDVALQPGDVLFVTDHPMEDVTEVINTVVPIAGLSTTISVLVLVLAAGN